jgi:hypothetical protein
MKKVYYFTFPTQAYTFQGDGTDEFCDRTNVFFKEIKSILKEEYGKNLNSSFFLETTEINLPVGSPVFFFLDKPARNSGKCLVFLIKEYSLEVGPKEQGVVYIRLGFSNNGLPLKYCEEFARWIDENCITYDERYPTE